MRIQRVVVEVLTRVAVRASFGPGRHCMHDCRRTHISSRRRHGMGSSPATLRRTVIRPVGLPVKIAAGRADSGSIVHTRAMTPTRGEDPGSTQCGAIRRRRHEGPAPDAARQPHAARGGVVHGRSRRGHARQQSRRSRRPGSTRARRVRRSRHHTGSRHAGPAGQRAGPGHDEPGPRWRSCYHSGAGPCAGTHNRDGAGAPARAVRAAGLGSRRREALARPSHAARRDSAAEVIRLHAAIRRSPGDPRGSRREEVLPAARAPARDDGGRAPPPHRQGQAPPAG